MKSHGKAAVWGLLFLFLSVPLLWGEESSEESPEEPPIIEDFLLVEDIVLSDDPLLDDEFLFYEEIFLSDRLFLIEDSPDTEYLRSEDFLGEDYLNSAEFIAGERLHFGDFPADETVPPEEPLDDAAIADAPPIEETPPVEEGLLAEAPPLDDDDFIDDEEFDALFAEGGFFFESPGLVLEVPEFIFETRSFDTLFPGISRNQRRAVMSAAGLKYSFEKGDTPNLIPASDSGIDLFSSVMAKSPSHLIEALVLVPYNEKELELLDIYNALRKIGDIQNHWVPYNGKELYIFEESTRLDNAKSRKSIPDPPPAGILPYAETMYLRLKEISFGNLFVRGDISVSLYGLTYSMTNFTDVRYFLIPIMKAERFTAIIYLEPVKEGILIYSMSGLYIPGFIADKVNLTPNINRRITVLINWIVAGIKSQ